VSVYLAMYSTEISIFVALCTGLGLGMWCGFELGRECPKRDAKGRFTR
jgi:hypothetical protein